MINGFYAYLANRTAAELEGLTGADYVPAEFRPVARHAIIDQMAQRLLGDDPQGAQYWICRIRQTMRVSPLIDLVALQNREAGYRIDDLAAAMHAATLPRLSTSNKPLYVFGHHRADHFTINRYRLQVSGPNLEALGPGGETVASATLGDTQTRLTLFPDKEAGCLVPHLNLPAELQWATRLNVSLTRHYQTIRDQMQPLARRSIELNSVFSPAQREILVGQTDLRHQPAWSAVAVALLIAGHTAAQGGDTL